MNYGKALRILRAFTNMTPKQMAEAARLSPAYISLIENGDKVPGREATTRLCTALNTKRELLQILASSPEELRILSLSEHHLAVIGKQLVTVLIGDL